MRRIQRDECVQGVPQEDRTWDTIDPYAPFNRWLAGTFHDELRVISPSIYLGLGCSPLMGGKINPFAFALSSAEASWGNGS